MTRTLTAAAVLALLTAPALADPPCLVMRNLYSWHELDKQSMVIEDIGHRRFKVEYSGFCGNLKFVVGIGVKSQSSSSLACLARGDILLTHAGEIPYQCLVQKVEPYSGPPQDNK
jgi:hypothetical protein